MRNAEGFLCVFSLHRFCGGHEPRKRVRPDGAALFLHRLSGVRELRKRVRPFRAGSFSLRFSGELRSAERGDSPRPAAGQEGRHQGFYPLNSHFLLGESGADCRYVPLRNRGRQRIFLPWGAQCNSPIHETCAVPDTVLPPRNQFHLSQARHDSAAQPFGTLYRKAPANLGVWHNLSS